MSRPSATPAAAPSPIPSARRSLQLDVITAHLREDRRHIHDDDMQRLKASIGKPLNFEMAATEAMFDRIAHPSACLLHRSGKADRAHHRGGLDVVGWALDLVAELTRAGIRVSMFIERRH